MWNRKVMTSGLIGIGKLIFPGRLQLAAAAVMAGVAAAIYVAMNRAVRQEEKQDQPGCCGNEGGDAPRPEGDAGEETTAGARAGAPTATAAVNQEEALEPDDLTRIKGIGPTTMKVFAEAGVTRFAQVAESTPDALKAILQKAGVRANPTTWPSQASELVMASETGVREKGS